jgi:hypothetical protein
VKSSRGGAWVTSVVAFVLGFQTTVSLWKGERGEMGFVGGYGDR